VPSVSGARRQGFREKWTVSAYEQTGNEEKNLARAPLDPF